MYQRETLTLLCIGIRSLPTPLTHLVLLSLGSSGKNRKAQEEIF